MTEEQAEALLLLTIMLFDQLRIISACATFAIGWVCMGYFIRPMRSSITGGHNHG